MFASAVIEEDFGPAWAEISNILAKIQVLKEKRSKIVAELNEADTVFNNTVRSDTAFLRLLNKMVPFVQNKGPLCQHDLPDLSLFHKTIDTLSRLQNEGKPASEKLAAVDKEIAAIKVPVIFSELEDYHKRFSYSFETNMNRFVNSIKLPVPRLLWDRLNSAFKTCLQSRNFPEFYVEMKAIGNNARHIQDVNARSRFTNIFENLFKLVDDHAEKLQLKENEKILQKINERDRLILTESVALSATFQSDTTHPAFLSSSEEKSEYDLEKNHPARVYPSARFFIKKDSASVVAAPVETNENAADDWTVVHVPSVPQPVSVSKNP